VTTRCPSIALAITALTGVPVAAQSPSKIKEELDGILANPIYELEDETQLMWDLSWFFDPIDEFFRWLQGMLGNAPPGIATFLYVILIVVLIALVAYVAYSVKRVVRRPKEESDVVEIKKRLPAEEMVIQAKAAANLGNYVDASRLLFEAALTALEDKRMGRVRRGLTNSEYLRTFRAPWVVDNLRVFVNLINWKWYRARSFDASDYALCLAAYEAIDAGLNEEE
jgi:hypothetical protein